MISSFSVWLMNLAHNYRNTERFPPCNRIQALTLLIDTVPVYLPEIVPSRTPTFHDLRIIFAPQWRRDRAEDVLFRQTEIIAKISTMAAQWGVKKVVWDIRFEEYDPKFRDWFERKMRKFMGLPDGTCRVEFVWKDGYYPVRRW